MKNHWQTEKLSDICDIEIGKTPLRKDKRFWDTRKETHNIWLSIADLKKTDGKIASESKEYISDKGAKLCKIVKEGTLLVSFKLTIGRLAFAGKDLYTNEAIAALNIKNSSEIDKHYLYYFLSGFDWNNASKGSRKVKGRTLNKSKLKELLISFPPLPEQKRIAKLLDEAFEKLNIAREKVEANICNTEELFESYLDGMFSNPGEDWEEKTLDEIASDFGRGRSRHRPRNDKKLFNGDYPFIQTGDVRNANHYITEYSKTYNEEGLKQSKLWPNGTVCITIAANIAETAILDFDACFPDSVIGVVPNPEEATSDFIEYLLQFYQKELKAKGKGSAQDNINMATFENEYFLFPSIETQKQIVKRIELFTQKVQPIKRHYQQEFQKLEKLKQSILQKTFLNQ